MKDQQRKADDTFGVTADVASATECTGLMPALPQGDAADANSAALCGIHGAKRARKKRDRKK